MPKKRVASSKTNAKRKRPGAKARSTPALPAPLTAAESPGMREAVAAGDLPWEEAQARLIAAVQGGRIWRTPEWNALRYRLIEGACAQCTSSEGPFTLQHFWHPVSIMDMARSLRAEHRSRARAEYLLRHPFEETTDERQACPRCRSVSIYRRDRVQPHWKCNYRSGRRICGHEFDEPVRLLAPAYKANAARAKEHWAAFSVEYDIQYRELAASFYVQATLRALELFEQYMSGEGTATFCRTCAFMWDRQGRRLCQVCRSEWHPHHEPACGVCARGVHFVLCAACGEHRHSDIYPTCYHCAGNGVTTASTVDLLAEAAHHVDGLSCPPDGTPEGLSESGPVIDTLERQATTNPVARERNGKLTAPQFHHGARVHHPVFGPGTVNQAPNEGNGIVGVLFDDPMSGHKLLRLTLAPLTLLGQSPKQIVLE